MKNVLNYFVRKAFGFKSTATAEDKTLFGHLLRIRQNIQGVYDWLYGKVCGSADGTIPRYMPMTEAVTSADGHEVRRPVLQNSDTLLAHLRLLDNRKISNGYADGTPAADGLPDGVSLARLLCDSSLQPTELIDDNVGWVADSNDCLTRTLQQFTNLQSITLNCIEATTTLEGNLNQQTDRTITLNFPYLATFPQMNIISQYYVEREPSFIAHLPAVKTTNFTGNGYTPFYVRELYMPNYEQGAYILGGSGTYSNSHTTRLYIGCKGKRGTQTKVWNYYSNTTLTDLEIAEGARQTIMLSNLDGLTPDNIVSHILDRLADNNYEDDGVTKADPITITLGATNLAKLTDVQKAIATSKNYTLV